MAQTASVQPETNAAEAQFVTLGVEHEVFAAPVESVLEIVDMEPIFHIPEAPRYMLGLIDLRGRSVPVLDLRAKLGLPAAPVTKTTRILVIEVEMNGHPLVLGLVADRVIEVVALGASDIEPAPEIGAPWRSEYIKGVGRRGADFIIIFDLPRLISAEDLGAAACHPRAGEAI